MKALSCARVCGVLLCCIEATAAQFQFPGHTITVPAGFEVEIAADSNLVPRPIEADFDEQGRLYVTDSSGSNDKVEKQLAEKPHRVLRLEDTDGDGTFDKSVVFADKMMFPEGAMWYDGSLYVAAPPSIWKLTDTNSDGVADVRVEWFQGKSLTGCANDLHGPYLGPDGWIYWCKGAFAKQTNQLGNGKQFVSRAAHVFRARPDGTGLEPVMTGGMDNPVGLAFTPEGERLVSGTFFQHPEGGKRDGIIHAIYGGVYGKIHDVLDDHPRTGDLMPIMTHLGPAAPAGMIRYESRVFGSEYQDNLFVACFNLHKITRHVLKLNGATFETEDSDFLVSDNTDFHSTDVFEDADGSLLIIDTGGWYKLCCPTSQLHKPDVLGTIYRVRKKGAPRIDDPRGVKLAWGKLSAAKLVELLGDSRFAVRQRARLLLRKQGKAAVSPLAAVIGTAPKPRPTANFKSKKDYIDEFYRIEEARKGEWPRGAAMRQSALWILTSIDSSEARNAIRTALQDVDSGVRRVALQALALHRDRKATTIYRPDASLFMFLPEERLYFELLGRAKSFKMEGMIHIKSMIDTDVLLPSEVRVLQHSLSYALIEAEATESARRILGDLSDYGARPAALIALDQMPNGKLTAHEVLPYLSDDHAEMRKWAFWVVSHHTEWGGALTDYFAQQLRAEKPDSELARQIAALAKDSAIQELLARTVRESIGETRLTAFQAMSQARLKETPTSWTKEITQALVSDNERTLRHAISTARSIAPPKDGAEELAATLLRLAQDGNQSAALRLDALAALPGGARELNASLFDFVREQLAPTNSVNTRSTAAAVLAKARLNDGQLNALAESMKQAGPLDVPKLLGAFERAKDEALGLKLVAALKESPGAAALRAEVLKPRITNFPAVVQQRADELLASLHKEVGEQREQIEKLLPALKDGDVRRGQAVFNSQKTACATCHAIGYLGGKVGPDLTRIGQVRNERDLIEALVFPSASFVRSYEPVVVVTKSGDEFSGVLRKDAPDEVVLATGPDTEARVARGDIADMRPGSVSVMPSGLIDQLSKQEIADLLAFLKATRW